MRICENIIIIVSLSVGLLAQTQVRAEETRLPDAACEAAPKACPGTAQDRQAAKWRKRNLILHNDGADSRTALAPDTIEGYLSLRLDHVGGCGIDTLYFSTTASNGYFVHDTKAGTPLSGRTIPRYAELNRLPGLLDRGADPLRLAILTCRKNTMEVFWSHRMNDIHDNWRPELVSPWKRSNPQFLMGTPDDVNNYPYSDPRHIWSFLNYEYEQVRDKQISYFKEVVNAYDVDGVDMDFLRHPCYFKESQLGKPVTQEHTDMLTEMVARIHRGVLEAAERKGKPILVSARILPTLQLNRAFGFDVETWAEKGYVDLLIIGCGYDPFTTPAKDMIEHAHRWGLPAYVCLSGSGISKIVEGSGLDTWSIEAWRGAASNAFSCGADGVHVFNFYPELPDTEKTKFVRSVYRDISNPHELALKDKLFIVDNLRKYAFESCFTVGTIRLGNRLPVSIVQGQTTRHILTIGDNIPGHADQVEDLTLRVCLPGSGPDDSITTAFNSEPVCLEPEKPGWWRGRVPTGIVNPGDNVIAVTYKEGRSKTLELASIELNVTYALPTERQPRCACIMIEPQAEPLITFAAEELGKYLKWLYGINACVTDKASENGILFEIREIREGLSDQGILIRSDGNVLTIAGGSPQAALWAVYELVQRWGVRYLIDSDVPPEDPGPLKFPENEIRMEPNMRIRCWRLLNTLPPGPISWSWEDNRRFLRQIAKMKYNRVHASMWSLHPFVQYQFRGMEKPPGLLYFGFRYPIDDDTIGKERFGDMREFTNPELYGAQSPAELVERGIGLVRKILDEAKALGIQPGISIRPFEWPRQFMDVLPGSEIQPQVGMLEAGPGKNQPIDDPLLREMVATIVRAYVSTYPQTEYIHIGLPEHRSWLGFAPQAYDRLDKQYGLRDFGTYEQLCEKARNRSYALGNQRAEEMLKSDLSMLYFFDSLVRDKAVLARPDGSEIRLVYRGIAPELYPFMTRLLSPAGEVMGTIDYTASRVLENKDVLKHPPQDPVKASMIFTLADDNIGVLPQSPLNSLHELLKIMRTYGWDGFYTRYWTAGDLDLSAHFLSLASWNEDLTPEDAVRDLISNVCGPECVRPILTAFNLIEETTVRLDKNELGVAFCVPNMMGKHYSKGGLSETVARAHENYQKACEHMRTTYEDCRPAGRRFLRYHLNRLHFAVKYLDAAEHFAAVGRLERAGQSQEAAEHAEQAYEDIRVALQLWADVARDYGDLGAIAAMNEYCYRPIRDKYKKMAAR